MRQLSLPARAYLMVCYVMGLSCLVWLAWSDASTATLESWLLGGVLLVVATLCQLFVVKRVHTNRTNNLTLAPFFAALLLLPGPVLILVFVGAWLPEWHIYRRRWFIQCFNIATHLIAACAARLTLLYIEHLQHFAGDLSRLAFGVVLSVPIFVGVSLLLLGWAFKLARGESFRTSGLFTAEHLFLEVSLVCLGLGFALAWSLNPGYGILTALPLALMFQTLHVPNLKEEAATDPKTGLANMRHFNQTFARSIDRAKRLKRPLSVLMCDLDYLRNINNSYGHQAGDRVLIGIAEIIQRVIPHTDIAARFGGEEFVILLCDVDQAGAYPVAERVRRELEQAYFDGGDAQTPVRATLSIGIATLGRHGWTQQALLHEADLAVYEAKRNGRNQVVIASSTSLALAGEWEREHLIPLPEPGRRETWGQPLLHFIDQITRANETTHQQTLPEEQNTVRHGNR